MKITAYFFLFTCLLLNSCKEKTEDVEPSSTPQPTITAIEDRIPDSSVVIPIGRLIQTGNSVKISINNIEVPFDTVEDGNGGYWATIHRKQFHSSIVTLRIRITKRDTIVQEEPYLQSTYPYLKNSALINWKNSAISMKAVELYNKDKSTGENVYNFKKYIVEKIKFNDTFTKKYGGIAASTTYNEERGVCINFSRVLIAMCRSVHIPTRSVSGIVYLNGELNTDCFGHHEWVEYLDDNKKWQTIEATRSTDLYSNSIKFIGLTYGAEDTQMFEKYYHQFMNDHGIPFQTNNGSFVPYCYLPLFGQKYGFILVNDYGHDSIVFQKSMEIAVTSSNFTEIK